ncbi:MAG: HEAT repeat domain-containing protein, partial [Planctomycetota bacterium]
DTVAPHLHRLLAEDPSYRVRAAAVRTLAEVNADGAQATAIAALRQDSHRESIRAAALEALFVSGHPEALERTLDATTYGRSPALIRQAIGVLERQAGDSDAVIQRLVALTRDPSFHTRNAAVGALGNLGAAQAVAALRERMRVEADHSLRAAARRALHRIATRGPGGVPEGR